MLPTHVLVFSEEAQYIRDQYRAGGVQKLWLSYKNSNGTYLVDGSAVPTTSYMPQWNKDHTGKIICCGFMLESGSVYKPQSLVVHKHSLLSAKPLVALGFDVYSCLGRV